MKNRSLITLILPVIILLSGFTFYFHAGALAQDEKQLVLSLKPGKDNPRNSEGDFVTLKDGRILFIFSRYTGSSNGDFGSAYLASRYSSDKGKTWSKEDRLVVKQEGDMNSMSVSLLRLKNGSIALFYLRTNSEADCLPYMRISTDEGDSWSEPTLCFTDRKGFFVVNNNRVIQLKNGRLLMPAAMHNVPGGTWSEKGTIWNYYSDDNGRTWKCGGEVKNPDHVILQEPGVVELKNGNVLMIIRASAGVQYLSWSKDKGKTWSPAVASTIKSPLSPATIARIPSTGDLLMVWNDNGVKDALYDGKRTPLNVAVSKDEGKTWLHTKTLEDDPDGWYCYTAIHFVNNEVLLSYCAGSQREKTHLATTNITKLNLDWIYR